MNIIDTETKRPTNAEIAARAYELYVKRGRNDGSDVADWLQAETELRTRQTTLVPAKTAKRSSASRLKKIVLG
jgi:outer membrane protein TolC